MRSALLAFALVSASTLAAQDSTRAQRFLRDCDDYDYRGRSREVFCEVRDSRMAAPTRALLVDGRDNGSVTIVGWDRNEVLVRAMIQARADTRREAEAVAKDVAIETGNERIRANGPRSTRYENWAVSYEIWVPRKTNLDAEAHNGGVSVDGVDGQLRLHTVNGSVRVRDVAGDVRAQTSNGSVSAQLSGTTWRGTGLDLETTNGSVTLEMPQNYSAELETGTVNGGMNIDFPITVQGFIGRRITTKLGSGGPRVRATTTNGSVRIRSTN